MHDDALTALARLIQQISVSEFRDEEGHDARWLAAYVDALPVLRAHGLKAPEPRRAP